MTPFARPLLIALLAYASLSPADAQVITWGEEYAKRILPMSPLLGSRLPAHAVSMGRVLLAGLSEQEFEDYLQNAELVALTSATLTDPDRLRVAILAIQKQGWGWVDGELDESICGLAVPVRDRTGATIAALNVSLPSGEFTQQQAVERFLGELRIAASRLRANDR